MATKFCIMAVGAADVLWAGSDNPPLLLPFCTTCSIGPISGVKHQESSYSTMPFVHYEPSTRPLREERHMQHLALF